MGFVVFDASIISDSKEWQGVFLENFFFLEILKKQEGARPRRALACAPSCHGDISNLDIVLAVSACRGTF